MSEIQSYDKAAGNNNSSAPDGFPEAQAPSSVNNSSREVMAAIARLYADMNGSITSAGTADVQTITSNRTITSYATGLGFIFKAGAALTNTGAITLNLNSIGAKSIKKNGTTDLSAGEITAGQLVSVIYDGTNFQLMNHPVVAVTPDYSQVFAAGTALLFYQASVPTLWTAVALNDKALRVVTNGGGGVTGGSVAFSTVFGITATDGHQLTVAQMPAHTHTYSKSTTTGAVGTGPSQPFFNVTTNSGSAGGNGSHTHNIDLQVAYADVVAGTKDAY